MTNLEWLKSLDTESLANWFDEPHAENKPVHAHWTLTCDTLKKCSNCGSDFSPTKSMKYCPYCGAEMSNGNDNCESKNLSTYRYCIKNTKNLRDILNSNPNCGLIVVAGDEANEGNYAWNTCMNVDVKMGEALCCDGPNKNILYVDRDMLREDVEYLVHKGYDKDKWKDTIDKKLKDYESFWKPVIFIYANN